MMNKSRSFSSPKKSYTLTTQDLMDKLAVIILTTLRQNYVYSFKGGWVLSKIFVNDFRKTSDVDMSIENENVFEVLKPRLIGFCENLMESGEIHNYKIKEPEPLRNRSGFVKLYRLDYRGIRYKVSGIDIGVKALDNCIVVLNGSIPVFTFERMLSDKFKVLFSPNVQRRIKDVFDTRLIIEKCELDNHKILNLCESNNVEFDNPINVFSMDLEKEWNEFLIDDEPKLFRDLYENLEVLRDFLVKLGVI